MRESWSEGPEIGAPPSDGAASYPSARPPVEKKTATSTDHLIDVLRRLIDTVYTRHYVMTKEGVYERAEERDQAIADAKAILKTYGH